MLRTEYLDIPEYEQKYGKITRRSIQNDPDLLNSERETSIIMTDHDEMALVSSSQKPVMKYLLLNNKHFILDDNGLTVKDGAIVRINGCISKKNFRFTKNPRKRFGRL